MGFFDKFKTKFERAVKVRGHKAEIKGVKEEKEIEVPKDGVSSFSADNVKETKVASLILSYALVTEKSASLAGAGKYVFVVDPRANKFEIKKAVNEVYGVMPESVRMIRMDGKKVRFGRFKGQRKNWKKAIVKMPKGKTLPIYE